MDFLANIPAPFIYLGIFLAKITEVTLTTLRLVYNNKGEKKIAAFIAFFEVFIWVLLVSTVLSNITEDPIKIVVYCIAFSLGNYIGVTLEGKLAVGLSSLYAIIPFEKGNEIACLLRKNNFGVTVIEGTGINDEKRDMLIVMLKRKRIPEASKIINDTIPEALITINDVKNLHGGYIKK